MIVNLNLNDDYVRYLEEFFKKSITDILIDYFNAEAETLIDSKYSLIETPVTISEKIEAIDTAESQDPKEGK